MIFKLIKCPQIALAAFPRCANLSCDLRKVQRSKFISISYVIQDDKKGVTTYDLHDRGKDKVSHKNGGKRKKKRKGERDYGYS